MFRFIGVILFFCLAACSNERTLNEENIANALGQHVQGASCVPFPYATSNGNGDYSIGVYGSPTREVAHLLNTGIAKQTSRTQFRIDFSIDERFREYFPERRNSSTEVVCGSPERIAEVVEFTIPNENSQQMTRVTYNWETEQSIPNDLVEAFPELRERGTSSTTLILTNNGWRVADSSLSSVGSAQIVASDNHSPHTASSSEFPFLGRTEISIPFTTLILETYWSIIVIVVLAYLAPSVIALVRRPKGLVGIVALNVVLGWTILGWLIALVWSFRGQKPLNAVDS